MESQQIASDAKNASIKNNNHLEIDIDLRRSASANPATTYPTRQQQKSVPSPEGERLLANTETGRSYIKETPTQPIEENQRENENITPIQPSDSDIFIHETRATVSNILQNENILTIHTSIEPVSTEPPPDFRRFGIPEINIFLTKVSGYFFAAAACALILLFNAPYDVIYFLGIIVMLYHCILDIRWRYRIIQDISINSEDLHGTLDSILITVSILFFFMKHSGAMSFSSLAIVPFAVSLGVFFFNTNPGRRGYAGLVLRLFWLIQAILISIRIDGHLSWNWNIVLIPTWIYLTKIIVQQSMTIFSLYKKIKQQGTTTPFEAFSSKIGFTWYIFYSGSALLAYAGIFAITRILNGKKDRTHLIVITIIISIISSIVCIATTVFRKHLNPFILSYSLVTSHIVNYYASLPKAPVKQAKILVEQKEAFFVMVSSTYFQPLHKSFITKEKETLNRITEMFRTVKTKIPLSSYETARALKINRNECIESIDIKTLKQEKEKLDKNVSKVKLDKMFERKSENKYPGILNKSISEFAKEGREIELNDIDSLRVKRTISEQNNTFYDSYKAKQQQRGESDENQCYLCCLKPADVIIIGCGHGGVCYDCAITSVKKKDQCMECRAKVEGIYRIDQNPRLSNIVKGTQFCKVITKDIEAC